MSEMDERKLEQVSGGDESGWLRWINCPVCGERMEIFILDGSNCPKCNTFIEYHPEM